MQASVYLRLFCHALLSRMPDDALVETRDSLVDLLDFYVQPLALPFSEPETEPKTIIGRLLEPQGPSPFVFDFEEE